MDKSDTLKVIAEKIRDNTKSGQLTWTPSTRAKTYKAKVGNGTVTITYSSDPMNPFAKTGEMIFLNERGDSIGALNFSYLNPGKIEPLIEEIYKLAENSYLKIDETLQSMLSSLK